MPLDRFGIPLGAHLILKGFQNLLVPFPYKINIKSQKGSPGRRLEKNNDLWMDFWCQSGRPLEAETSISNYTCCNLKVSLDHESCWKMHPKRSSKIIQNWSRGRPRAVFFLIWGRLWMISKTIYFSICFPYILEAVGIHQGPNRVSGSLGCYMWVASRDNSGRILILEIIISKSNKK